MAYTINQQGNTVQYGIYEVVCDTLENLQELPSGEDCDWSPGSSCIVLENSSVWMLGNDLTWHQL